MLVLDEADRLLDPTFESELRVVAAVLPQERQTLLFSATMTQSLVAMQSSVLRNAHCFQVQTQRSAPMTASMRVCKIKARWLNLAVFPFLKICMQVCSWPVRLACFFAFSHADICLLS